jgi:hypothetical protein
MIEERLENFHTASGKLLPRVVRREALQRKPVARSEDCMIWTHDGTWLESNGQDGRRRSSFVGVISFYSAEQFCLEKHLRLVTHQSKGVV